MCCSFLIFNGVAYVPKDVLKLESPFQLAENAEEEFVLKGMLDILKPASEFPRLYQNCYVCISESTVQAYSISSSLLYKKTIVVKLLWVDPIQD